MDTNASIDQMMEDYREPKTPLVHQEPHYREPNLTRCQPDDPNRCQSVHANIQCPFRALGTKKPNRITNNLEDWEGPKYCSRHAATTNLSRRGMDPIATRMYQLTKWRARLDRQTDNPKIKSLREELGVLRMTLENKLEQLPDEAALEMRSSSIVELCREIAKTALTCQKIERENAELIDRTQASIWTEQVIQIISTHISPMPGGPEILTAIASQLESTVTLLFPTNH